MIAYASRTGTKRNLAAMRVRGFRLLVSATGAHRPEGFRYMLDNGAWTAHRSGKPFSDELFVKLLTKLGRDADMVVLPDVVMGGLASLAKSLSWLDRVHAATELALLPVQNGMTVDDVRPLLGPRVGIFVGGDDEWKDGTTPVWGALARELGVWCHVGRVNAVERIKLCERSGVHSFDGTSVTRFAVMANRVNNARRQASLPIKQSPTSARKRRQKTTRRVDENHDQQDLRF